MLNKGGEKENLQFRFVIRWEEEWRRCS